MLTLFFLSWFELSAPLSCLLVLPLGQNGIPRHAPPASVDSLVLFLASGALGRIRKVPKPPRSFSPLTETMIGLNFLAPHAGTTMAISVSYFSPSPWAILSSEANFPHTGLIDHPPLSVPNPLTAAYRISSPSPSQADFCSYTIPPSIFSPPFTVTRVPCRRCCTLDHVPHPATAVIFTGHKQSPRCTLPCAFPPSQTFSVFLTTASNGPPCHGRAPCSFRALSPSSLFFFKPSIRCQGIPPTFSVRLRQQPLLLFLSLLLHELPTSVVRLELPTHPPFDFGEN